MTSDDPRLQVGEYLAGSLSALDHAAFESRLQSDTALRAEVAELKSIWEGLGLLPQEQPSAALRARFYQKLNGLSRPAEVVVRKPFWNRLAAWQQVAIAAGVFLIGLYVGQIDKSRRAQTEELAQMRNQVQGLREMVALSLLDRQSAASRLQGVSWSSRVDRPNTELRSALLGALNGDPNVNVRLSSVDALERYSDDSSVRKALADSIPQQESPLVQIALIDTLVRMRDTNAMSEFQRLSKNQELNSAVRQRANWALVKLQPSGPETPDK